MWIQSLGATITHNDESLMTKGTRNDAKNGLEYNGGMDLESFAYSRQDHRTLCFSRYVYPFPPC